MRAFPVPKIDNSINEKDFQPISILQVLSKIHEKLILKKLSDYIERTSIYNSTLSGLRKGHSTQTILLKFRDDIQKALNKNEMTMSVFIDYSKAFGTIQHQTLIKKLANVNLNSIKIILSYLCNRQQMIKNPHIDQYTLGFHRAVFLAVFYLLYMFHHYHHV